MKRGRRRKRQGEEKKEEERREEEGEEEAVLKSNLHETCIRERTQKRLILSYAFREQNSVNGAEHVFLQK